MSNFIVQALRGEPITIYGDGRQTRSFCYVDDLIDGLIRLMATPKTVTGPVNLGNPGEFTIRELAEMVLELTSSRSRIVIARCPKTIRSSGSRTYRWPESCSIGRRVPRSRMALFRRLAISINCSATKR